MFIVLWKVEKEDKNDTSWMKEIKKTSQKIQALLNKQIKDIDVQVGIGNAVGDITEIPKSYREAHDALDLGDDIERLRLDHRIFGIGDF